MGEERVGDCGTVLVIDTDPAFRTVAEDVLERIGCTCLFATSGVADPELVDDGPPVLAIVAVELPGVNGLTVLRELHDRFGEDLPVILTSSEHVDAFHRTAGLLLGADDYLVKPLDAGELCARIRRILKRSASGFNGRSTWGGDSQLSRREREVLLLLAEGFSQREISATLVLSPKTVATHIQHVLSKLGVHSRAEAVAAAYRRGLVDADVAGHAHEAALVVTD